MIESDTAKYAKAVIDVLDLQSGRDKTIFLSRFRDKMTLEEIGKQHKLSIGQVCKIYNRIWLQIQLTADPPEIDFC
jgi:DNA-directed RNA polymerase specialized sigma subunit